MSDIVDRLRGTAYALPGDWSSGDVRNDCTEAADEIERLRGLLHALAAGYQGSVMTGNADGGAILLQYATSAQAEAAHDAWADWFDAHDKQEQP